MIEWEASPECERITKNKEREIETSLLQKTVIEKKVETLTKLLLYNKEHYEIN